MTSNERLAEITAEIADIDRRIETLRRELQWRPHQNTRDAIKRLRVLRGELSAQQGKSL